MSLYTGKRTAILLAIFAIVLVKYESKRRPQIPEHLLHSDTVFVPNLFSQKTGNQLLDLIKEMAEFPSNVADLKFYQTIHQHIGEAEAIGENGKCSNPYLVPSLDRTVCSLPGRIDVARHYFIYGGVEGLKESYEDLSNRLQSFGRYIFNISEYPAVQSLFASDSFQKYAKSICPKTKQFLDPFQFNFIIQIPGQTVALHLDAPYFWGASRFQYPQWLLVVMVFSGLFRDRFVDQIQTVGYLHQWNKNDNETHRIRQGEFAYWDTNEPTPKTIPPSSLAGSIVDGSKTIHAATVYYPHVKPPRLPSNKENTLKYDRGSDSWILLSDNAEQGRYSTDDLRISIVYRARCFANDDERRHYHNQTEAEILSMETILDTLSDDLIRRGRLSIGNRKTISRFQLAMLLLDEYIKYPLPINSVIPFNYCMLMQLYPWTRPLLSLLC